METIQNEMKVAILGNGLLGSELHKKTEWDLISREEHKLDITEIGDPEKKSYHRMHDISKKYDVLINCMADTDTYSTDKESHWNTNYKGAADLVHWCNVHNTKLVHISTDYVYVNGTGLNSEEDIPVHHESWYAYTKLLADGYVQLRAKDYLLVRCSHKPNPFPYQVAFNDLEGNFDYVDVIAAQIIELIQKKESGIWNLGTPLKTMYDLAKQTSPEVLQSECTLQGIPKKISMDLSKLNKK